MGKKAAARPSGQRKIFGLSISEEIEWGVAYAVNGLVKESKGIERGILPNVPTGNLPHPPDTFTDVDAVIKNRLTTLKKTRPALFNDVDGIGISTIGVVERETLLLDSIVRKNWGKRNSTHIIDFGALFLTPPLNCDELLFPRVTKTDQIVIQNDASARCKTEYLHGVTDGESFSSLLYLMLGEGINGAVAYGGDLLDMLRHSEMGHCMPQLHPADLAFNPEHSGCPAHTTCFEGIASTARIRQQWPELQKLTPAHPAWKLEAFYLAQLVMIGVASLNPQKIRFGGAVFAGTYGHKLIEDIRLAFLKANAGYLPDYKSAAAVATLIERAHLGDGVKVLAALTMGFLAAFPEDRQATLDDKVVQIDILRKKKQDEQ